MFVAYYAVYMVALKYGLGVHQWNVRLKTFSKLLYVSISLLQYFINSTKLDQ